MVQFDHAIDEKGNENLLIYSHYPIFIGLIMVTVSMSFLVNPEAHHLFATSFFIRVSGSSKLRSCQMVASTRVTSNMTDFYYGLQVASFLIGLVLSLLFSAHPTIVITTATLMTLAMKFISHILYMAQTKEGSTPNWELF